MIGDNIKRRRKQLGWSQEDLAEKVGMTRSHISNIEQGKRKTDPDKLKVIANVMGLSIADLYDEDEKYEEDGWSIFVQNMKSKDIDPETAKKWIEFAENFIKDNR